MKVEKIAFEKTNSFSDFFLNYVNENDKLKAFYNHFPTLQNFEKQNFEKKMKIIKFLMKSVFFIPRYLTFILVDGLSSSVTFSASFFANARYLS